MLQEVKESKTLPRTTNYAGINICGQTAELKFLVNGLVNNPQNYISAAATRQCTLTDSSSVTIQSIKKTLHEKAAVVNYYYSTKSKELMHNTAAYYYSTINPLQNNAVMKDTFYAAKDSFDINKVKVISLNNSLPDLPEGSAVLNEWGELIGIVQKQQLILLHRFLNQIKN
jgi:hypothetical protein